VSAIVKDIEALAQRIGRRLPPVETNFPLKVPAHFIERIATCDHDGLLAQVLPTAAENQTVPGFSADAVGDLNARPAPALLHKYHGRALVMLSPRCHIHCRFCFRRHFPYEQTLGQAAWQTTLDYLHRHEEIHEVILSGGDPLTLSEAQLTDRVRALEAIPHIQTLRIHSRSPIAAPALTPQGRFLHWARHSRLNKVLVVHCNHPDELSKETAEVLARWRQAGFTLLNQSVLLRGVNDQEATLEKLSHSLWAQGVLPYYLHLLDRVQGAAHFEVSASRGIALIQYLRQRLPGYLVPRLVREIANEPCKTPVEVI